MRLKNGKLTDPAYSFEMIFLKPEDALEIEEAVNSILKENSMSMSDLPTPVLKHGNTSYVKDKPSKGQLSPIYKDRVYTSAKSKKPIAIVEYNQRTGQNDPMNLEDESKIYVGCICDAIINVSLYEAGPNIGITIYAAAIRKLKDGERQGFDPTSLFGTPAGIDLKAPDLGSFEDIL